MSKSNNNSNHPQSILVTEILNLGADPQNVLNSLVSNREKEIGYLRSDRGKEDIQREAADFCMRDLHGGSADPEDIKYLLNHIDYVKN